MAEDELFRALDLNSDGVIDGSEWAAGRRAQLLSGPAALASLLDSFAAADGSGLLDVASVNGTIELFNALHAEDRAGEGEGQMHLCPARPAGKVSRSAAGAVFTLYAEGAGTPLEEVSAICLELLRTKRLFLEWIADKPRLEVSDLEKVAQGFNAWARGEHARRAQAGITAARPELAPYDPSVRGADVTAASLVQWAAHDLFRARDSLGARAEAPLMRLRVSLRLAVLDTRWERMSRVGVDLFGPVLAAFEERDWAAMTGAERAEVVGRVSECCSAIVAPDGGLEPRGVSAWIRAKVMPLPEGRLEAVIASVEDFASACGAREENAGRIAASFARWDKNGDGVVGRGELQSLLSKVGDLSPEEMDALLEGADTNGDGRINYSEFARWVVAAPEVM